ncbi:hypothetical protein DEO72_LG10g951 [Vigna unguiculata]|uniref:Uncharacterized protein n=1 Tax=Vigna unguiculata TaxID=3917 RepID=A0A4D6N8V1_VIGUN|nr:hypothetical protein DEO72_LG10g951 [Vigna unguiculata]
MDSLRMAQRTIKGCVPLVNVTTAPQNSSHGSKAFGKRHQLHVKLMPIASHGGKESAAYDYV